MNGPVRRGDLDPATLADAAVALGRSEDDVVELRDDGDLLVALVARLVLDLRRIVSIRPENADDAPVVRLIAAIRSAWGRAPFGAGELVDWIEALPIADRRAILEAVRVVGGLPSAVDVTAQRMGQALRRCGDTVTPEGDRLDGTARRGGAVLWRILDAGESGGRAP